MALSNIVKHLFPIMVLFVYSCAEILAGAVSESIDLLSPKVEPSQNIIWINNRAYRNCTIEDISQYGAVVRLKSGSDYFDIQWNKLSEESKEQLRGQYYLLLKRREEENDRREGITRLFSASVITVTWKGPIIKNLGVVCVVTDLPSEKKYADGEIMPKFRVKATDEVFQYNSSSNATITARVLKYIGE